MKTTAVQKTDKDENKEKPEQVTFLGSQLDVEDPAVRFITSYYKQIVALLLIALLGYFGFDYYQKKNVEKAKLIATQLESIKADLSAVVSATEVDEKIKTKLSGELKELGTANYQELAGLITTFEKIKSSELKEADLKFFSDAGYSNNKARFFQELTDLTSARYLLDLNLVKGKQKLQDLVTKAQFVSAPALVTLLRIAESQAEIAELEKISAGLVARQPEIAGIIERFKRK